MKRKATFKETLVKPLTVNDSRFGIRRMFLSTQERPRIKSYTAPGRGQNGESQN
jgi:hypothetical protein